MEILQKVKKYFKIKNFSIFNRVGGQAGFSMPELIIGVYIFSLVMVMGSGAIMAVLRSQRIALKEQELLDNTRGSLEVMSKSLRLSYDYRVPAPGDTGINSILVNHPAKTGVADCPTSGPCPVRYFRAVGNCSVPSGTQGVICEQNCPSGCAGVLGCSGAANTPGCAAPLTSDQVNIRELEFIITGFGTGDDVQARVTVYMEFSPVVAIASGRIIPIQTTLTQRLFDIP